MTRARHCLTETRKADNLLIVFYLLEKYAASSGWAHEVGGKRAKQNLEGLCDFGDYQCRVESLDFSLW